VTARGKRPAGRTRGAEPHAAAHGGCGTRRRTWRGARFWPPRADSRAVAAGSVRIRSVLKLLGVEAIAAGHRRRPWSLSLSICSATPPATAAPTRHQPATSLRLALALSLKSSPSLRRSGRPSSSLRRRPPDPPPPRPQTQLPLLAPGVSLVAAAGGASTSSLQRRRRRSSSGAPSPPRARRVGGAPANAWPQTQRMASSSSGGILLSMWFG